MTGVVVSMLTLLLIGGQAAAAEGATRSAPIEAGTALVVDVESGAVLVDESADAPVSAGGLSSILTVGAALMLQPGVQDASFVVSGPDIGQSEDGFDAGTVATFDQLAAAALVANRPEATRAIARGVGESSGTADRAAMDTFTSRANDLFTRLGLEDTTLDLETGGTSTSARDIAAFMLTLLRDHPELQATLSSDQVMVDGQSVAAPWTTLSSGLDLDGAAITDQGANALILTQHGGRTLLAVLFQITSESWVNAISGALQSAATIASAPGALESLPRLAPATVAGADGGQPALQAQTLSSDSGVIQLNAEGESSFDREMLRWPLIILTLASIILVLAAQRQAVRQLRRRPASAARRRQPAHAPEPAPNPSSSTPIWDTQQLPSISGD